MNKTTSNPLLNQNHEKCYHIKALEKLQEIKKQREGRRFRLVQIDAKTWKEIEI